MPTFFCYVDAKLWVILTILLPTVSPKNVNYVARAIDEVVRNVN
jgi:hypothetical protein